MTNRSYDPDKRVKGAPTNHPPMNHSPTNHPAQTVLRIRIYVIFFRGGGGLGGGALKKKRLLLKGAIFYHMNHDRYFPPNSNF